MQPPSGYPTVDALVEDARLNLDRAFQQALLDRSRARKLINSYREWLTDDLYQKITDLEAKANRNTTRLSNASVYCYDHPYSGCLDQAENTTKLLETYDASLLSIKTTPLLAYQRCELARQAAVTAQVVTESSSMGYRRKGFAPVFFDNSKPSIGVEVWDYLKKRLRITVIIFRSERLLWSDYEPLIRANSNSVPRWWKFDRMGRRKNAAC